MPEEKYKYILMVSEGGTYFANSLWGLFKEIVSHRTWHWKRGEGWVD